MSCPVLLGDGGIADALRAVDCRSGEVTAAAFGRLFGTQGALLPALTILLTLYVALFAVGLMTGRGRIGVSALTPRMMTLGLVLTFATSWAAYQGTVWTLATGAPDQLASIVAGTKGSATTAFANRLDGLFTVVADAAQAASKPAPATPTGITPATPMVGGFSAATVLWLSALMLLLGTVGVLVTTKIALAALLALGPVFVVMALFRGTRGLFEGWLKAVVLLAVAPLFAVLIGGVSVAALGPVARSIAMEGPEPAPRAVALVFLGAAIHVALMVLALRMAGTMVSGWRLSGDRGAAGSHGGGIAAAAGALAPATIQAAPLAANAATERTRALVSTLAAPAATPAAPGGGGRVTIAGGAQIIPFQPPAAARAGTARPRAHGIGSRFRGGAATPGGGLA